MNKNTMKIVIAVVCLAIAGVIIAMSMGGSGGGSGNTVAMPDGGEPIDTSGIEE